MEQLAQPKNRPDDARLNAWIAYLRGYAKLLRKLESDLETGHQLTVAEYDVLIHLNSAPQRRMRMKELAEALLFSTGGVSRLFDRLEKDGLVTRERTCQDKRGVYAVLTDEGRARLRAAGPTHLQGIHDYFAASLPDDELEPVSAFLARLAGQPLDPDKPHDCTG